MKTDDQKINFKTRLREYCLHSLEERLGTVEQLVITAQESANNEGKSSAGDKYETGRAMGHLQKEMYQQQAVKIRHELLTAKSTEIKLQTDNLKKGTVVITDRLIVFICVGLGKKKFDDETVLFVSDESPLFKTLIRKRPGDLFIVDKAEQVIREIW
ncbi:MAG: hypothetical protein EOO04_30525 [Chitinophagaceae bacterium]|nr:MAG: hypothetical protein EOO04_30525 [Chitinophagaceae bacterium]